MKEEMIKLRKEHEKIIEMNRLAELQKKKEARDKIHQDCMQSRMTIQQFYLNKHASIVEKTKEEVRRINEMKASRLN